nr:retrovirus-related Pol polyprotein from transposon TNT 1-94 [Tanacetum cinerariifolium]
AYRVYNLSSKKVEEMLNLRYLEDKPNVQDLGQEWYFNLDYLTDSLGYTCFITNPSAGPTVKDVSTQMENNLDYAEELARLQRQEYEAHSAAAKHGFEFFVDTAALLPQANIEIRRNLVPAGGDPAGGIVPTGGVPTGSDPAGGIVSTGGDLADSNVPTSDVPVDRIPASSVPAGGVFAGSLVSTDSTASSVPDASIFVPAIAISTKWILKNKRDARGIVVRNKARLVAQGHRQEEGIDYDEVFTLVTRIEAIQLFLAFSSYMGFMVYQIDVKSAFLYGEIEEEVYVTQPKGFEDPYNLKHVYRVVKALYGLHQAPRTCQDKYVKDMLKKFDMESVRT